MLWASLVLGTLLFSAGCRSGPRTAMTRDDYVQIYVEILMAADAALDSVAASDSARAILARHGFAENELIDFARAHADDPGYLALVWLDIETRLRNPTRSDSIKGDTARVIEDDQDDE